MGNWLITGMRCWARFMVTCGMRLSAADFTSIDWTMSRCTSSGMSGPEPGVARVAIELYGVGVALLERGRLARLAQRQVSPHCCAEHLRRRRSRAGCPTPFDLLLNCCRRAGDRVRRCRPELLPESACETPGCAAACPRPPFRLQPSSVSLGS